jgi:hypothetical protein
VLRSYSFFRTARASLSLSVHLCHLTILGTDLGKRGSKRTREVTPTTTLNYDPEKIYSLPELIDLAESHNPETRVAWERARAQAAAWGIARSELYPTVGATALAGVNRDLALSDGPILPPNHR